MSSAQESDVPETGDMVDFVGGMPPAMKRGPIVKVRGEGEAQEWCVRVGFKEVWTKEVTLVSKKAKPRTSISAGEHGSDVEVGTEVQVMSGQYAGWFGTVATISGTGDGRRWRVKLDSEDIVAGVWVDKVVPAHGRRSSVKAAPQEPAAPTPGEIVEGSFVEILDGAAAGSFGNVVKVAGDRNARRYRVQVEGQDKPTWSEQVRAADKSSAGKTAPKATKAELMAHYATLRSADPASVPWAQAKSMLLMDGGSGGALLVDLGEECIVIKPQGATAASEAMAECVATCCGVRVGKTKIVKAPPPTEEPAGAAPAGQSEHEQMLESLKPLLSSDITGASMILGIFHSGGKITGRGKPLYGKVEFVPGSPMMGLEAQKLMVSPPPALLTELGRLCALDVLLNNMDRVPLPVWQNDGNMGNVMIAAQGTTIVGIDQQINSIRQGSYRDTYVKKVLELMDEVAPDGDPTDIISNLTQVMHTNMGLTLERAEADLVVQGLREGFQAIGAVAKDGSLAERLEAAAAQCTEDFGNAGSHGTWGAIAFDAQAVTDMKGFVLAVADAIAGKLQSAGS